MSCGCHNEQKNTNKFKPQPLALRKNKFFKKRKYCINRISTANITIRKEIINQQKASNHLLKLT